MSSIQPSRLLKTALVLDAAGTAAIALVQLFAGTWIAKLTGLPDVLLFESGIFLAGYAALLLVLARRASLWSALPWSIVLGNVGWAVGCAQLLSTGLGSLTALGVMFVLIHAVAVLGFAALEFAGLRRSAPTGFPAPVDAR
jgi:hypothetical protein